MRLTSVYVSENNYPMAKQLAIEANQIAIRSKNSDLIIQSNTRLGFVYRELNMYDSAFTYLFKNVELAESKKDEKLEADAYTNVGALFLRMKNYNKADFYYSKALKLKEGTKDARAIAEIYSKLGTINVAQKKYDEALTYLSKAEKLIEGLKEPMMLANIYGNLGRIHLDKDDPDKAIAYFEKTEKLGKQFNSDQILTRCYSFLSRAYLDKYKKDQSSSSLNKAQYYGEENYKIVDRVEDDNAKCVAAGSLYNIHKLKGNAKEALKYHEIYTTLNDTLTQSENNKYVADINFKYETDKQDRIIKQINLDREKKELELEVEKQRSRNNMYIALFIIVTVVLGGGLFFNSYKQKQQRALIQLENEKLISDINFLKAQVDPHTIFNTINTIHGQLAVDVKSGRDNLVKFSELMHYQLYECNDKLVDVEKEIQHLEKYIDLQKLRRSGKIELECSIDPNLKELFVAPLLFIPLVENAFKYVSNNTSGNYFIKIDLTRNDNKIRFTCTNSCLKKSDQPQIKRKSGGIGLDNLKKRLNATYNDKHTLVIAHGEETFTTELEIYVD